MSVMPAAVSAVAQLFVTTADAPWREQPFGSAEPPPAVTLDLDRATPRQRIDGFGACFNEQGWEVLTLLDESARTAVLRALFDPRTGCGFNLGRVPIGANDYALDWYSLDETPDDFALAHFSIARDRRRLIPYVRAARALNPALRLWASPWCPPTWMKTNGHYACAVAPVNDLRPDQAGAEMVTQFRMEPRVLDAYARYFAKFLDAWQDEGVPIAAVHVQNEPNSCQNFPSCVWRPEDLATFIGGHLGPLFEREGRSTEIWLGTIERPQLERVTAVLDSPAGRFVRGVGFQWAGRGAIAGVRERYPRLRLAQTETECGDGSNDWAAAVHTWELMRHYFAHGAESYMYWNPVLDETGSSRWGWRQNAMLTVDRTTKQVRFNPEFWLMKHLAAHVARGADFLETTGPADAVTTLAFRNPDGSSIVIAANVAEEPRPLSVVRNGSSRTALLPARSFATLRLP